MKDYKNEKNEKNFFIDTNILVYCYDEKYTEKKKKSENLLINAVKNKNFIYLSNQIISEFSYILIKKAKLNPDIIKTNLKKIISPQNIKVLNYTDKTILSAIEIYKYYNVPFWDSLIIATMLENNIFTIYTENKKDFTRCKKIEVINPFE
ncbi:MAG: PIN domain-containing protein [Candidatus Woesearchaeota archaeon]